jgi:hypothetical protein
VFSAQFSVVIGDSVFGTVFRLYFKLVINIKNIAKSDTDLVLDMYIQVINSLVGNLVVKLYKRNSRELAKARGQTIAMGLQKTMSMPTALSDSELQKRQC